MKAEEARAMVSKFEKPPKGFARMSSIDEVFARIKIAALQGSYEVPEHFWVCDHYMKELKELGYKIKPFQMAHNLITWYEESKTDEVS